jgi:hypothetical protein
MMAHNAWLLLVLLPDRATRSWGTKLRCQHEHSPSVRSNSDRHLARVSYSHASTPATSAAPRCQPASSAHRWLGPALADDRQEIGKAYYAMVKDAAVRQ